MHSFEPPYSVMHTNHLIERSRWLPKRHREFTAGDRSVDERVGPISLSRLSALEERARFGVASIGACIAVIAFLHFMVAKFAQGEDAQPPMAKPDPVVVTLAKPAPPPPPPPPPPKKITPPKKVPPPKPQAPKPVAPPKPAVPNLPPPPDKPADLTSADVMQAPKSAPTGPTTDKSVRTNATPSPAKSDEKITAPSGYADYLNNPAPAYPAAARRLGYEGKTILKVYVLANGKADKVEIQTSSGYSMLDQAAITAVSKWAFVPAKRGDTPINGWVNVPMTFKLGA